MMPSVSPFSIPASAFGILSPKELKLFLLRVLQSSFDTEEHLELVAMYIVGAVQFCVVPGTIC